MDALTNCQVDALLADWMAKAFNPDQPRDPYGRWTAGGGGEQVHDPVRVRRAAINTAVHATVAAAALANALASAGGLRQAQGILEAVTHAGTLAENLRELRDRCAKPTRTGVSWPSRCGPRCASCATIWPTRKIT